MNMRPNASADLAILVVAAGRGARAGDGPPKQYRQLAGRSVLAHALAALHRAAPEALLAPVIHPDDIALYEASVAALDASAAGRLKAPAFGGATRQESVRAGLEALEADRPRIVLIHDAARIFAGEALIERAIDAARAHGAAIPGVAVTDTIKEIDADSAIVATRASRAPARGADAAGVRFRPDPRTRIAGPPRRARSNSPTTPPSPNGRAIASMFLREMQAI